MVRNINKYFFLLPLFSLFLRPADQQTETNTYKKTTRVQAEKGVAEIEFKIKQRGEKVYFALWIENKEKYPVRYLGVWGRDYQYRSVMTNLEKCAAVNQNYIDAVSSASLDAGHYRFTCELTDNYDQPLLFGSYVLCAELRTEESGVHYFSAPIKIKGKKNISVFKPGKELLLLTFKCLKHKNN